MIACKTSEINTSNHFVGADKMIKLGFDSERKVKLLS